MTEAEQMNAAISYVEEHLNQDIDFDHVCRIACMSKSNFQRTFLFFAGLSMKDYVRKRRLSMAAQELSISEAKVIDVAVKYGYDSAAAFTRAYKSMFGDTPSNLRSHDLKAAFSPIQFQIKVEEGEMKMNEKTIVRVEGHANEKVVCFEVDCFDAEEAAWGKMSTWCKENIPDRTARRFIGLAPKGHHPDGENHQNASEHVKHPYIAMMFLIGDEVKQETFHGLPVHDAPDGIYLVNDVALNQYDEHGKLDMALSMIKASDSFVDFVNRTDGYEFDMKKGIFYEEHIFSEQWFQEGGLPTGFRMWVPVLKQI